MADLYSYRDPLLNPAAPPAVAQTQQQQQQQTTTQQPAVTGTLQGQHVFDYLRDLFTGKNRDPLMGEGDYFNNFDVTKMGNQFDPNFLLAMQRWLSSLGIKMQIKPSDNGMPSGRLTLPNGQTFDTNVGGLWGWLARGILGGEGGPGGGGGSGSYLNGLIGYPTNNPFGENGILDNSSMRVFSDPATVEWETLLRRYVNRLQQPYSDPDETAAENYYRSYFQRLQGPAYTPQEMDLLNTQQIDPLTADRDAQRQKVMLWASSHGMDPNSGPVQQMLMDTDRQYEALRTRARADIATKAIDLGRENEARAMQVGSALAALREHMFNVNENRFGQAVSTMKQIPEYADTRLQLAMAALGMGGGGAVNGLSNALGLLGKFQDSQSGGGQNSDASFWASLLGAGLGAIPFFG